MKRYNPKDIEPRWQKAWAHQKLYKAVDFDKRPKYIMLTEFPYPSGDGLHMGHVREYTYGDILARHKRMQGYNVFYPMGYDAFGLPTENYAIKNKIPPEVATERNIATFRKQFDSLGYGFDWDRAVNTTDPNYYKWTQWLFLQFYKAGLAYQDEIAINWCPKCKTGLANEEVVNGRHERCDTLVEKKLLKQWLLKITDYADRLIDGLKDVDYPSRIADQQINWIGRSEGALISFKVSREKETIDVFTTAHDTIYGATFIVLAPEHPLVEKLTAPDYRAQVHSYIKMTQGKTEIDRQNTEREKTGVATGAHAINPVNGREIPVWIADYVLMGYGTGAIMAVPGEDERDHEFAQKYGLPIIYTTEEQELISYSTELKPNRKKYKLANSEEFNGLDFEVGRTEILKKLKKLGVGKTITQYKLRDWIFSRQHYWGEPIPIIHCQKDGAVAVPEKDLPVKLPPVENYEPTDTGKSPLAAIEDWVNVKCPKCGGAAKRETDTMPNWAGSSWYYLRYYDPHNDKVFADRRKLDYWGAVDMYLGGMEHTTLHLLYSRFWHQFLYDQGLVPTPEPYKARRGQGIILAPDGAKMSKSKGNVINPTEIIDAGYGADATRLALAFLAPYDQTTPWNPEGVAGTYRFLNRVWTLVQDHLAADKNDDSSQAEELRRASHAVTKRVTEDLNNMNFNTAIAALMEYVNELYKLKTMMPLGSEYWLNTLEILVKLIAPFAPHVADELWTQLGTDKHDRSVHVTSWPVWDEAVLAKESVTIVVQVNGKVRANIHVPADASEEQVASEAKADENVAGYLKDKTIKKSIFVPNKLINFVV